MPSFIVKQPNGRYARFTTVCDGFTHMNMTHQEAVELCCQEMGTKEGHDKVERADNEEICACSHKLVPGEPLHRWNSCISHMLDLGDAWLKQIKEAFTTGTENVNA